VDGESPPRPPRSQLVSAKWLPHCNITTGRLNETYLTGLPNGVFRNFDRHFIL
jgi:hypothetical protein